METHRMKARPCNDRDEFERIVRQARMERTVYLSEAIAGAAQSLWQRIAAVVRPRPREEEKRLAAR
jgi:hypothetical protein